MSTWPVEKAEEALRLATDDIGKALVTDVLEAVKGCKTFSAISDLSRRLIDWCAEYPMKGLCVWDDVSLPIWNKADELAVAEMNGAIGAIVAEMGFCERQASGYYHMTACDVGHFLELRRPKHNAELGDELMKRLAKVVGENPALASRAAEFLNKGRRKTPRGDPLTAEVRKQCEAARKRPRKESE
jgi:hypothetical protein